MSERKLHIPSHLNEHTYPGFLMNHPRLIHLLYGWNRLLLQRNRMVHQILKPMLKEVSSGSVLDAGCGEGQFIFPYASRYPKLQFTGIDKHPEHLAFCRQYQSTMGLNNAFFINLDLTTPLPQDSFDLLYCIGTLQYIERDTAVINSLYQTLKPGGRAVIYTPVNGRIMTGFYRYCLKHRPNYEKQQRRKRVYRPDEIMTKITASGFEVRQKKYTYGPVGILGHELYSIILIGIASGHFLSWLCMIMLFATLPIILVLVHLDQALQKTNGNGLLLVLEKRK